MDGTTVATNETANLIASDMVVGTSVYNRRGESLGSVYGLMLNKVSGQVAYAIMSFGGFLGLGERYHPLPWRALTYDTRLEGYVIDADRDRLEAAPNYGTATDAEWLKERDRVDAYYAIPPV